MATGLKYYFGIDFGTTNSATVGYVVMDEKPEMVKYGDEEGRQILLLLQSTGPPVMCLPVGTLGTRKWN